MNQIRKKMHEKKEKTLTAYRNSVQAHIYTNHANAIRTV